MKDEKDIDAAAKALYGWLKSQDIAPAHAIPVLVRVICVALFSLAEKGDIEHVRKGARIVSDCLLEEVGAD